MRHGLRIRREGYLKRKLEMLRINSRRLWMVVSSRSCSKRRMCRARMEDTITNNSNNHCQIIKVQEGLNNQSAKTSNLRLSLGLYWALTIYSICLKNLDKYRQFIVCASIKDS